MRRSEFYPYVDEKGKKYFEQDIFFKSSDEENMKDSWKLKKGENYPNVFSPKTKRQGDGFPMYIRNTKTGKKTDQKVTKQGHPLPLHAGTCQQVRAICFALPDAGKTAFYLKTIMNEELLNALTRANSSLSFLEDMVYRNGVQQHYAELLKDIEEKRRLPGNTLKGMQVTFPYFVSSDSGEILLSVTDLSGEDCLNLEWNSPAIISNQYFLVMIDVEDLLEGRKGYISLLEGLIKNLKMHRIDNNYEVMIILTKADKLKNYFDLSESAKVSNIFENSIEVRGERIDLYTNKDGFDMTRFKEKEKYIQKCLSDECPNLINLLKRNLGRRVRFFLVAATGCDADEFQKNPNSYQPYCIEEPWMYILQKYNIIPRADRLTLAERIVNVFLGTVA